MQKPLCVLAWLLAAPIYAATVTTSMNSNQPLDFGTDFCSQTSSPQQQAACFINADFSDPTGRHSGGGNLGATAGFGLLTGTFGGGIDRDLSLSAAYIASFSDLLSVGGGTGSGTLIAHYTLHAEGFEARFPFVPLPTDFRFLQGAAGIDHRLLLPSGPSASTPQLTESFDVASAFEFGVPLPFGAGMQVHAEADIGVQSWSHASSLQLTGFSVLDASGNPVAGGQVTRAFVNGPDPFVPEPGTCGTVFFAGAVAVVLRALLRPHQSRNVEPLPRSPRREVPV